MNTNKSIRNVILLILFFTISIFYPKIAKAGHDHDHISVTMTEYLGHDQNGMHMIKVNHYYDKHSHYYIVYLRKNAKSLRGHVGDSLFISFASDGKRWARLTLRKHGTWQIDGVKAL